MEIRISEELNSIISLSRDEAMRTGSYGIAPDHLMLGIIRHGENSAMDILRGLGTDVSEMKQFIDSKIFTRPAPAELVYYLRYSLLPHSALSAYEYGKICRGNGNGNLQSPVQGRIITYYIELVL